MGPVSSPTAPVAVHNAPVPCPIDYPHCSRSLASWGIVTVPPAPSPRAPALVAAPSPLAPTPAPAPVPSPLPQPPLPVLSPLLQPLPQPLLPVPSPLPQPPLPVPTPSAPAPQRDPDDRSPLGGTRGSRPPALAPLTAAPGRLPAAGEDGREEKGREGRATSRPLGGRGPSGPLKGGTPGWVGPGVPRCAPGGSRQGASGTGVSPSRLHRCPPHRLCPPLAAGRENPGFCPAPGGSAQPRVLPHGPRAMDHQAARCSLCPPSPTSAGPGPLWRTSAGPRGLGRISTSTRLQRSHERARRDE